MIAPESTAAACRKFDREAVSLGDGGEYVVIFACILVWSLLTLRDVGCGHSFDEKGDLGIACENYVMLRGVD